MAAGMKLVLPEGLQARVDLETTAKKTGLFRRWSK
jgi:hypothetical protein